MTSRLYPTTWGLYRQVVANLRALSLGVALTPLSFALSALYVSGLILLDRRQNATRLAEWLPGRAHDAFNRLLGTHLVSTRALLQAVLAWAKRLGRGYLVIDEVLIEKPFAKQCAWMGWAYSTSQKRYVFGLLVVVLLWCSGAWRIPVAFRLWRAKRRCAPRAYRTRPQLAWELLCEVIPLGLVGEYVVFDKLYTAGWLTKKLTHLGLTWVGVVEAKTVVHYRNRRWHVADLAVWLQLKWRQRLALRAQSVVAYLPKYGTLRLVVTRNRHGNYQVLATNDLAGDLTTIVLRKRSRWSVETLFRDAKQFSGLAACQCRADAAWVRHVALVLIAFIVLQRLRRCPEETLGAVKERLQHEAFTGHYAKPAPLKAKVAMAQLLTA